jgi:hypothetical protein
MNGENMSDINDRITTAEYELNKLLQAFLIARGTETGLARDAEAWSAMADAAERLPAHATYQQVAAAGYRALAHVRNGHAIDGLKESCDARDEYEAKRLAYNALIAERDAAVSK